MLLNRLEFALMNNPLRAAVQRYFESRRFLSMAGPMNGGRALEIGCGRGVGTQLILELFRADTVDAFDLDPRMVALARRLSRVSNVRFWVADASAIPAPSATYDAVFDFGIIHHIPDWRKALAEVARVLKPGGRFYVEEILAAFIDHPIARRLLDHPQAGRFDAPTFTAALQDAGMAVDAQKQMWGSVGWFVATRKACSPASAML